MNTDPVPTEHVTLKAIAVRAKVGVKKLGTLIARPKDENPFPVEVDLVQGFVANEQRIQAWEKAEKERRLSYPEAVAQGRIRARKAS